MNRLEGKVAIVTGATSGMGRAIAALFAREGAAVLASGRDGARGQALVDEVRAAGGRAAFAAGDAADPATGEALVRASLTAFGGVDIVVPCAGMLGLGSITDVPLETWHETLAVNLDSVFYLLRAALPEMRARGGGTAVVIGSIAAFKGFPNHAAYCASKGALVALVRQAAKDYAPDIRINLICPGPVDTPFIWASASAFPDPSRAVTDAGLNTPMKRLGSADDVARAALFLASSESAWVTGTTLTVDGGAMTG
jgi:NAD(P)-dependent dehydrogenase (short-subunit alcohol dehydrogenase family)